MQDDIPLGEPLDNRLWIANFPGFLNWIQQQRIARFLQDAAGSILAINPNTDLTKLQKHELLALAIRSHRMDISRDVVGSFLALAVEKRSLIALAMLSQVAGQAIRQDEALGKLYTERKAALGTLRFLHRALDGFLFLDEFDKYRDEVAELAEAVRNDEIWAQISASESVRASYRVIAPGLKSLLHLEASAKDLEALKGPLFLWRSKITSSILAEVLAGEFPHFASVAGDIARFVVGDTNEFDRPILLVGIPGIGKDSILRRAAQLVGRPIGEYDLAGAVTAEFSRVRQGVEFSISQSSCDDLRKVSLCQSVAGL